MSKSVTETSIANNNYHASYPNPVNTPRTQAQWAGRLLLELSIRGKGWPVWFCGFQKENKEKDGIKMNEQITAGYKDKYIIKQEKVPFIR